MIRCGCSLWCDGVAVYLGFCDWRWCLVVGLMCLWV